MTRRNFIQVAALASAQTQLPSIAANINASATTPKLRVGIISDPHVTGYDNAQWMEKAFRLFAKRRVDAVLVTGDMGTTSFEQDWQAISKAWYNAFPNDALADGSPVTRLFLTGNHDLDDWFYHGNHDEMRLKLKDRPTNRAFSFHRQELWRKYWGEDYAPIFVKRVKGYTFILRNWLSVHGLKPEDYATAAGGRPLYENHRSPLAEILQKELPAIKASGLPFFYCQHDQMPNTVNATHLIRGVAWNNGEDEGNSRKLIEKCANCVVFTGHSHSSLTDEMSIWQGSFTAVNCGCARGYAFSSPGRENGFSCPDFGRNPPFEMPLFDHGSVRHGMVMEVFSDRITLERFDLTYDQSLGENWEFPLFAGGATVPTDGTIPKYDFKSRQQKAKAPTFAPDAKVTVKRIKNGHHRTANGRGALDLSETHEQLQVTFPPIRLNHSPSRGFDFKVTCLTAIADCETVVQERRVFSPNYAQAETRDTEMCTCCFPASIIPSNRLVRFSVTPYDCWGNAGKTISTPWFRPENCK